MFLEKVNVSEIEIYSLDRAAKNWQSDLEESIPRSVRAVTTLSGFDLYTILIAAPYPNEMSNLDAFHSNFQFLGALNFLPSHSIISI